MMKTIFIVELFWTGHHPTYLKLFTKSLLELGHKVIVLCPEPDEVNDWVFDNCEETAGRIDVYEYNRPELRVSLPGRMKPALVTVRRWKEAATAIAKISGDLCLVPDLVFFMYLDVYLNKHLPRQIVDTIFKYNWSGLYFAPFHLRIPCENLFSKFSPLRRDSLLNAKNCKFVTVLDEGVVKKLQFYLACKPVVVVPDIADISPPARCYPVIAEITSKARGRKIIGLLGALDKRKGLLTLLEVARQTSNEDYFFVIAGRLNTLTFSEAEIGIIDTFLKADHQNCCIRFEFIPDEASFNALVDCCDIIFAAYERFYYSSNLLTKAAYFHKRVIVSDGYCMAERTRKYNLGVVVKEGSVADTIGAIRCLTVGAQNNGCEIDRKFDAYVADYSIEQLKRTFAVLADDIRCK